MYRIIDAEQVVDLLWKKMDDETKEDDYTVGLRDGLFSAICIIDETPAFSTVKRGRWINQSPFDWKCSECGFEVEQYCEHKSCPNCGAKMDGEVNE